MRAAVMPWAARVLRPLKTYCWVCNMLRGIALGLAVGVVLGLIFGGALAYCATGVVYA